MGITLKDVADYANVSMSTVSRVINKKTNSNSETTKKVERAIAELLYKPTPTAERLTSNSRTIAVVAPGNPSYESDGHRVGIDVSKLISEIEALGHIPFISTVEHGINENTLSNFHKMISGQKIDGVIICDSCDEDNTKNLCRTYKVPFVETNGITSFAKSSYVDYDNSDGAFQAVKYLTELGHQKIGIISGPHTHGVTNNRLYGVYSAIEKLKLDENNFTVKFVEYSIEGGEMAAKELAKDDSITAYFAFSDRLAVSAITALRALGKRVPEDISVVGFDDMEICQFITPPLTSVKRYSSDISPVVVRTILDLIEHDNISKVQILYNTELILRSSCKAVK